jgi:DNA helicase HerA-like ATPase
VSCVLSLEGLEIDDQMRAAAIFLNAMFDADHEFWYPGLVVVDEAQMFAPAAGGEVAEDARKMSLGAMTNLMCRGRKRGLAGVIATQRLAKLAKNVAAEASNFLMGRTFLDIDMARAADLLGMDRRQAEMFRDLQRGNFVGSARRCRGGRCRSPSARWKPGAVVEPEADADARKPWKTSRT